MAPQNSRSDILSAWRALSSVEVAEGWRTIPLMDIGDVSISAGRHFPSNEEALLVGFKTLSVPSNKDLPKANGFKVSNSDISASNTVSWLGIARTKSGDKDLFEVMILDIVNSIETKATLSEQKIFDFLIGRINAWQNFMRKGKDTLLSYEEEVGLFGELIILRDALGLGANASALLNSWAGPQDGLHDFRFRKGSIEVKTSCSNLGFPIYISSLDQLDSSLTPSLHLIAVRLQQVETGVTLGDLVDNIKGLLTSNEQDSDAFERLLISAGFLELDKPKYTNKFSLSDTRVMLVDERFPKITRPMLATEIFEARYKMDIQNIPTLGVSPFDLIKSLGE